ncbi:hypothetical protein N9A03_05670, partial [Alphaproteobacteria bacterium]|nr:hypothetical protein [Alphaproteobacteria bacterium]
MAFEKDYSKHDYNPSDFYPGRSKNDYNADAFKYYDFDGSSINLADGVQRSGQISEIGDNLYAYVYLANDSSVRAVLFDKETSQVSETDVTEHIGWLGEARIEHTLEMDIENLGDDRIILKLKASANDLTHQKKSNVVFSVDHGNEDDPSSLSVESAHTPNDTGYFSSNSLSEDNYQIVYTDSEFNVHYPFSGLPADYDEQTLKFFPKPIPLQDGKIVFVAEHPIGSISSDYFYRVFDVTTNTMDSSIQFVGSDVSSSGYGSYELISSGNGEIVIEIASETDFMDFGISKSEAVLSISAVDDGVDAFLTNKNDVSGSAADRPNSFVQGYGKLFYVDPTFNSVELADLYNISEDENFVSHSSYIMDNGKILLTVLEKLPLVGYDEQGVPFDLEMYHYVLKSGLWNPRNMQLEEELQLITEFPSTTEPSLISSSLSSEGLELAVAINNDSEYVQVNIIPSENLVDLTEDTDADSDNDTDVDIDAEYATLGSGSDTFFGSAEKDHISTGGGDDKIMSAGGDDVVVVQGQGDVEVDTGAGDDRVIVEDGWSGTLLVKNG